VSPTEIVRVRLDGGPNSVKCLINNSKWGMNPVLEEEEGESASRVMLGGIEKEAPKSGLLGGGGAGDYSSGGSGSNHRNSSPASIHHGKTTIFFHFDGPLTLGNLAIVNCHYRLNAMVDFIEDLNRSKLDSLCIVIRLELI